MNWLIDMNAQVIYVTYAIYVTYVIYVTYASHLK